MLVIKLKRLNNTKRLRYWVILTQCGATRKILKVLGYYNPLTHIYIINRLLIHFYLKNGAQLCHTLRHLLFNTIHENNFSKKTSKK